MLLTIRRMLLPAMACLAIATASGPYGAMVIGDRPNENQDSGLESDVYLTRAQ